LNADTFQLYELARSWPPALRDAFFFAYRVLVSADRLHFGLIGEPQPKHALRVVEAFADLKRRCMKERCFIPPVETFLMTARGNQPFRWGADSFTCAHRGVLSLASTIASCISLAMSPETSPKVHYVEGGTDTDDEEGWKISCIQIAQTCSVLTEQKNAGERWETFCQRYQKEAADVLWEANSADNLQTDLMLEANGAASLMPNRSNTSQEFPSGADVSTSHDSGEHGGWKILRDAPPAQIRKLPAPATGRFVIAAEPSTLDGIAEMQGQIKYLPQRERLALAWKNCVGEWVLHPTDDGLLLHNCQRDATWLPAGWEMDVFPTGWTLPHLEAWFECAFGMASIDDRGDIFRGSDKSPRYAPTPRGLVAHAHLIVRHLCLANAPTEPRGPMDRAGCLAELRDVLAYFRRTLHTGPLGSDPPLRTDRTATADDETAYRPASEFLQAPYDTFKAIRKVLKDNPEIRRRNPRRNRLVIHAGDWVAFLASTSKVDPLDAPAAIIDAVIETQHAKEQIQQKKAGK
jgi:hypothetical protein